MLQADHSILLPGSPNTCSLFLPLTMQPSFSFPLCVSLGPPAKLTMRSYFGVHVLALWRLCVRSILIFLGWLLKIATTIYFHKPQTVSLPGNMLIYKQESENIIHKDSCKSLGNRGVREEHTIAEKEVRKRLGEVKLLALKINEGPRSQKMQVTPRCRRGKGADSFLESPQSPSLYLDFSPVRSILAFWPPELQDNKLALSQHTGNNLFAQS